jgi:hypothetical protein
MLNIMLRLGLHRQIHIGILLIYTSIKSFYYKFNLNIQEYKNNIKYYYILDTNIFICLILNLHGCKYIFIIYSPYILIYNVSNT